MKITHDTQVDAAYIALIDIPPGGVSATRAVVCEPNVFVDFDDSGCVIGIEVLDARRMLRAETLKEAGAGIEPATTGV